MQTLRKASRYAWLVVALLWLAAVLNYLDRLAITSMHDSLMGDAGMGMEEAHFGLITSIFLWVYAAFSPAGGLLADRVGRQRVIIGSLAFWSAATWLLGHAQNRPQLFLASGLMGVSEACYIPAALALITDYHRGPTRSLATGIHMSGSYIGLALSGAGGYVASYYGWRYGFTLLGAVGVGYALVLMFLLRDVTARRPAADEPRAVGPPARNVWAALFSQPAFLMLLALDTIVGMVNWPIYAWLPTYLKEHFLLDQGPAGVLATVSVQAASLVGALAGGAWADRWSRRRRQGRVLVPAIGYFVAAPCLFFVASTHVLPLAIVGLVVYGLGRGFFDCNLMPILREVADQRHCATGYGVLNCIGSAAGGVMAYAAGALKGHGVDICYIFQGSAIGLLIVAFMLLLVRMPQAAGDPGSGGEQVTASDVPGNVAPDSELPGSTKQ